jgi:hypothetical protein
MPKAIFPHARSAGLVVTELDDEILVYDKERDKAHCLNHTAALVWKYSNGKRGVAEIAAAMQKKLGSPVDAQIVWFALGQLEKDHLLRNTVDMPKELVGVTRREFVRQMGMAAMMVTLPLINSMSAPDAGGITSCVANGQPCTISTQCCSQCCSGTQVNPGGAGHPPSPTCQPAQNCT